MYIIYTVVYAVIVFTSCVYIVHYLHIRQASQDNVMNRQLQRFLDVMQLYAHYTPIILPGQRAKNVKRSSRMTDHP